MHARRIILAAVTAAGLALAVAPAAMAAGHAVAPHAVAPQAVKAPRTFAAAVCDWKGVAPDKCLTRQGGAGSALFNANYDAQTNQDYGFQFPSNTACTNNKVTATCPFTNDAIDDLLEGKSITTIRNNSFGDCAAVNSPGDINTVVTRSCTGTATNWVIDGFSLINVWATNNDGTQGEAFLSGGNAGTDITVSAGFIEGYDQWASTVR